MIIVKGHAVMWAPPRVLNSTGNDVAGTDHHAMFTWPCLAVTMIAVQLSRP
jgi:hypothetical protein